MWAWCGGIWTSNYADFRDSPVIGSSIIISTPHQKSLFTKMPIKQTLIKCVCNGIFEQTKKLKASMFFPLHVKRKKNSVLCPRPTVF